jgi:uncharacterized membrane protein
MKQTTNYALKKIELSDSPPDITVINPNWDVIDEKLKEAEDFKTSAETQLADIVKIKSNITILSTGWVDNTSSLGFWTYDHNDADITVSTVVDINIRVEDLEKASNLKSANLSSNGSVRLYASSKPESNLIAYLKLNRAVV